MDKFFYLSVEDLLKEFADKSRFYVPFLAAKNSDKKELQEAFLHLLPGEKFTFNLQKETTISLTCLNGESEVLLLGLPPIKISSDQYSRFFYVRLESIAGQIEIKNTYVGRLIVHVTSEFPLTPKLESCDMNPTSQLIDFYKEQSNLIKESERIFRLSPSFLTTVGLTQIFQLQDQMGTSRESQSRICCHPQDSSMVQDMFLSFCRGTTFPIMKHLDKSESLMILNGTLEYRIYSELGELIDTVSMSGFQTQNPSNKLPFYIWINRFTYHSPLVTSKKLLAKETTSGPFLPDKTLLFN